MEKYLEIFLSSFSNYGNYIWNEITFQTDVWYVNYFWMLTALSFLVWGLEVLFPWRKNQKIIRKDFWLDAFYMYFNFYIFKLIIFTSFSAITAVFFSPVFGEEVSVNSISKIALFDMSGFSWWLQLIIFFVALDFVQWLIHNILHRVPFLWEYHKVHHSVEEMGFAAHLRFHWMENVIYTPAK